MTPPTIRSLRIGGDVDSIAAIVMGIVGAREGLRFGQPGGIPMFMIEDLEAVEYIVQTADAFSTICTGMSDLL